MNPLEEGNRAQMITQGATTAVFTTYFQAAYVAMIPWFLAAIPLILIDLKLGRKKARLRYSQTGKEEDKVTFNKSVRMTFDKSFSYICWIMLSTSLAMAFEVNAIKYVIMAIVYGLEVISSIRSWLQCKGINVNDTEMFRIIVKTAWNRATGGNEEFIDVFKNKEDKE